MKTINEILDKTMLELWGETSPLTPDKRQVTWELAKTADFIRREGATYPVDAFEIHPCREAGRSETGRAYLEQCEPDDPNIVCWSVYAHKPTGGKECLCDFDTQEQAEACLIILKKNLNNGEKTQ
jgi:hypothetical protein